MHLDTLEKAGFRFRLDLHRQDHPALSDDFWSDAPAEPGGNPADAEPEGAEDQQAAQGGAEQTPVEDATTEEGHQEEKGPAPDGGKWLDRFDNYEDAEKAYKALQSDFVRLTNGLRPKNPQLVRDILGDQVLQGQMPPGYGYPQVPQAPIQGPGGYAYAPQGPMPMDPQSVAQAASEGLAQQQAEDPEAFWKKFSENPQAVLSETVNRAIQQVAQPVAQFMTQTAVRQRIADMRADTERYPGFREVEADIADYLEANPYLAQQPNGLEVAYHAVRGIHSSTVGRFVGRQTEAQRASQAELKQRATAEGQRARTQTPQGGQEPKSIEDQIGDAIVAHAQRGKLPW